MAFIQSTQAGYNSFVIDTADGGATSGGAFQGGGSKDKGAAVNPYVDPTGAAPSHNAGSTTVSPIGPVPVGGATGTVLSQISSPS